MTHPKLEICVDNAAGLNAAIAGGADRIELCAALDIGGLTPLPGLIAATQSCPIPVRAMIRPRAGDFCYTADEIAQMKVEITAMHDAGLEGVVLGASTPGRGLDTELLRDLIAHAGTMGKTLHRVVDTLVDCRDAVGPARGLGFDTILSSGGAKRAADGGDMLADMVRLADGKITIMPGSGVNIDNGTEILKNTGAAWLHSSCSTPVPSAEHLYQLGFCPRDMAMTDAKKVTDLTAICHGFRP